MKISELDIDIVKSHLKIDDNYDDILIESYLKMTKNYILSYTGLTETVADEIEDLTFAALAVIGDFYENRLATTNTDVKPNKIVESILGMHSVNLI